MQERLQRQVKLYQYDRGVKFSTSISSLKAHQADPLQLWGAGLSLLLE